MRSGSGYGGVEEGDSLTRYLVSGLEVRIALISYAQQGISLCLHTEALESLGLGPAHQGSTGPLGTQHTKGPSTPRYEF